MIEFRVLGPLEVVRDGEPLAIGGLRRRAVLAMLVLEARRVVSVDRLVDGVWGDEPPDTAVTALHGHVSHLRRALGDRLVTRAPGHVDDDRPSGIWWALLGGTMIGLFNVCVGQFSGDGALLPLVVVRLVQSLLLAGAIVLLRQPWRMSGDLLPKLVIVGVLDMVGNAAFILAAQTGQLAIAAVLSSLYPVTTVILAIAILRERVTRSHLVGIGLTALAIVLIGAGSATL